MLWGCVVYESCTMVLGDFQVCSEVNGRCNERPRKNNERELTLGICICGISSMEGAMADSPSGEMYFGADIRIRRPEPKLGSDRTSNAVFAYRTSIYTYIYIYTCHSSIDLHTAHSQSSIIQILQLIISNRSSHIRFSQLFSPTRFDINIEI